MAESSSFDEAGFAVAFDDAEKKAENLDRLLRDLERNAAVFSRTMSAAFVASATGARSFEDVLKSVYLRLSELTLRMAIGPLEQGLTKGMASLLKSFLAPGSGAPAAGGNVAAAFGAVKPFAAGGVIGMPTYFPLLSGGVGLAGEAGPEAILPLARGSDGRLGVAASGGRGVPNVTVNIATPDADSFRRSEAYVTGQIARAVARGQRGL